MAGIGQRIKRTRQRKKVTVAAIAAAAGVKRQAVYAWESGDSKSLKGGNLVAVAKVLDVSVEWLDSGKGPEGTFSNGSVIMEAGAVYGVPKDLSPEAIAVAKTWMQLSPGRRAQYQVDMAWARFFESKFPTYRLGVASIESYDRFERSVEADWDKMMRQHKLPLE